MATKRERAVAILDAVESKARLKSRTLIGTGIAVVFLIAVAYITIWQFALGGGLLIALLLQMTHERMTVAADAMIEENMQKLGWKLEALDDEDSMTKLRELANRNEGCEWSLSHEESIRTKHFEIDGCFQLLSLEGLAVYWATS